MLKGISPLLSPMLLKVLCEMGHGDTIVIADGNFPAETMGKDGIVIRMDGHGVPEILEAILEVFFFFQYVEKPVYLMNKVPGDNADVSIWKTYEEQISKAEERGVSVIDKLEGCASKRMLVGYGSASSGFFVNFINNFLFH